MAGFTTVTVDSVGGIPAVNHVPDRGPSPGGADQGLEQALVAVLLGVPFDADDERRRRQLDSLDHTVGCPCRRRQSHAETIDGLMVRALDRDGLVNDLRQQRSRFDDHHGGTEATGRRSVPTMADDVREVLEEAASEMDVQQLHPPADGKHRQISGQSGAEEFQLAVVAAVAHTRRGGIGNGAVAGGVHVPTTDQNEGVKDGNHVAHGRLIAAGTLAGRQEQRAPARTGHAVHIGHREHGGRSLPRSPGRILPVRRDSDERRLALRHVGQYPTAVHPGRPGSVAAMPERLSGKVALITGAGSGIGRVAAELFASEGAAVVVADVAAEAARDTVAAITANGGRAAAVTVDVADEQQVADMVGVAVDRFGALDVLFNNAGIFPGDDGGVLDTPPTTWDRVMQVNVKGVWLGCRAAVPAMIDSGGGSIINVASFVALMGAATAQVAYTASKGGVLAFTRELAVEYARAGIRANSLCPGPIDTPLLAELLADPERRQRRLVHIPMGRLGRPVEIARAALFLASDDSSFMTGSALVVDGGITAAYVTPE